MKKSFKSIMMWSGILLCLAMMFTSCEGEFDDLFGEWSRPGSSEEKVLGAALKEGAIISYTIIENGVEKIITFQKEGDKYVLISPASTRMHDVQENKRYILDWDSDDDGSGNSGGTNNGPGGGGTFVFNVIAADGTPALTVVTRVVDASTQVATYDDHYDLKGMTLNGQQLEQFNQALEKSKNGPKAKLTCTNPVLSITLSIPELGVTTWKDINYDGIKLESDANYNLVLTYKCIISDAADAEPEDVKFEVFYNNGESTVHSAITDLVGKPTRDYILARLMNRN